MQRKDGRIQKSSSRENIRFCMDAVSNDHDVTIQPIIERIDLLSIASVHIWEQWSEINETIFDIHSVEQLKSHFISEGEKFKRGESYEVTFVAHIKYADYPAHC